MGPEDSASCIEAAKLFALRRVAEGQSPSMASAMALRLMLSSGLFQQDSEKLTHLLASGFQALCSQAPLTSEQEKILPLLTQVQIAVEALPAQRGVHFLALNLQTPSGTLREVLTGEVGGIGGLHPGGLLLWRGCASVTTDPCLAKEAATNSRQGVALVFRVRTSSARDVAEFSPSPDLRERLLPPRRFFRIASIHPLEDMVLRRGLAGAGPEAEILETFEAPDLGQTGPQAPLTWEDACSRRAACIVVDEEEPLAPAAGLMMGR